MSHIKRGKRVATEIECPECGKSVTKQHLKRHREVIHQKKEKGENDQRGENSCKECGRSFGRAENLRRHLLVHSGEKPYKCTNCDYSGALAQTLRRHMARRHREAIHLKKEK